MTSPSLTLRGVGGATVRADLLGNGREVWSEVTGATRVAPSLSPSGVLVVLTHLCLVIIAIP